MVLKLMVLCGWLSVLALLINERTKRKKSEEEKQSLISLRDAALDISNRVLHVGPLSDHYQYILETCIHLVPKAEYGSILMFDDENLLRAKASVGFNTEEIENFRLRLEESFLYIASDGAMDRTMIINRIEDIIQEKNIISSSSDADFVLRSEITAPLHVDGKLAGMLCLDGTRYDLFTDKDVHVIEYMSRQISSVISRQKLYDEVLYLSRYDHLTNLLNRGSFEKMAIKMIQSKKNGVMPMYLVIIDLDGLKQVNDTYGHSAGDQLISVFAGILNESVCGCGLTARYGGDEFVCLFHGTPLEMVQNAMWEMKQRLKKEAIRVGDDLIHAAFSYGTSSLKEAGYRLDVAYMIADRRMYEVKNSERTRWGSY